MSLKSKVYLENQKKVTNDKLAIRISSLKERGLDVMAIKRDGSIKKLRGDIRKANHRLACIAAQEKLNADKLQIKMEKLAAKKNVPDKLPAKKGKVTSPKKEKKKASPPSDEKE